MYKIREFAAMTGLPQSKIRFYEKQGLLLSDRQENGYRVFTPEDAFRSNAFRVLLQYGFSIDQAVAMLDEKQDTSEFKKSLMSQQEKLRHEADLLEYRLARINNALDFINAEADGGFTLVDAPDQFYVNASIGRDFSISLKNEEAIAEFYELLSVTSCARIINKTDFENDSETVDPNYIITLAEQEKYRLSEDALAKTKRLHLGKCFRFRRQVTRSESVRKETFGDLMEHLRTHGYHLRGDIILFPSFLNLDGQGSDIETLYVPID